MTRPAHSLSSDLAALCALFDSLEHVQFWIKDRAGRYQWVNRGFLLNYSLERREQAVGKTDFELSPPHLADQFQLDDEGVLRGKAIIDRVELVGRFDRTAVWSVTQKIPLRDRHGRITGTAGLTRPAESDSPAGGDAALSRVVVLMRENCAEAWSNAALAKEANLSVRAFERRFVGVFQVTPQQYLRKLRVRGACHALVYSGSTLAQLAADFGFADQSHFTREFRRETKFTPAAYRKKFKRH